MGSLDLTDLAQIVITDELFQRPQRATNFEAENYALHSLASQLTKSSQDLLQSLASVAVEICRAGSAGISIPETGSEGEEVFRWVALAGAYTHVEKTIPRHFTLCNICLERRTPQLYSYPGRYFEGLQYLQPPMVECLVLPIFVNASPLGTLWIVAHDDARQFDAEDLRIMGSLAQFTAVSLYQMQTHDRAEAAIAKEQLARKKAEAAIQLRDEFIATVSHELRTPLANMKVAIRMLSLTASDSHCQRYLQILETECNREVKLVNNLLDLQRLEAGIESVLPSPTDLSEWLTPLIESFQDRMHNQQQALELYIPAELPLLMIDTIKLERVITELLNNACKYTPAEGTIEISVSLTPNLIEFSLSNTGIEIPASALPKLFDKFYRATEGTQKEPGSGLGLALAQRMVDLMEGKILAKSQDKITTFTIVLPRVDV
ncbi:MAG: GAF domain-containing sensor histidine kinase [Phormidesmis sp.]